MSTLILIAFISIIGATLVISQIGISLLWILLIAPILFLTSIGLAEWLERV
jgi:hypothetical protein